MATLRLNVVVGENLGNSTYKLGFLCIIGIAHLPETLEDLKYSDSIEIRPTLITDIGPEITTKLLNQNVIPEVAIPIVGNLFHSLKLIT